MPGGRDGRRIEASELDTNRRRRKAAVMKAIGFTRWEDLTTEEIPVLAVRDPVVILPLAAVEQHGPHLPLSTDLEIGLGLLRTAAAALETAPEVVQLPAMMIGTSAEHEDFPGTISLEPETALAVIGRYGAAVAAAGFRRLLLVNSHGGNTQIMELGALRLRRDHGLLVVSCSYFHLPPPESLELPANEIRHGIHGGALETAMMLHLAPGMVREEARADAVSLGLELAQEMTLVGVTAPAPMAWLSRDLHPSGVVGDARLATAELGRKLVLHYGGAIAQVIRETSAFPLGALRPARP
jgi:creatinine amidohydrolase